MTRRCAGLATLAGAAVFGACALLPPGAWAAAPAATAGLPWWAWPLLLFGVSFLIGIIAVAAGIGGGVLFVPIVGSLFPFHLDFIRGAGLMLALCGALSAGPRLLRQGLAELRVVIPLSLAGSAASMAGAHMGLLLPTHMLHASLGIIVLVIAIVMWASREGDTAPRDPPDALAVAFGMGGLYRDPASGSEVPWQARHVAAGVATFAVIGFVGGMFGLGAGWANVPALNLLMGLPLKLALGTSTLSISAINTSAAWVYLNQGALLPIMHVPAILGVIAGARVGVRLLKVLSAESARWLVIGVLFIAGARALLQGLTS
ncbi:MAG TPA: sulfite exporter TauE/SafE family protein [Usitatibacter sp.]|jgi:hypothetical protein|nr:sulfite exporter TauE/SafE family protein [Usitatibacter sp.]